MIKAAVFDFDGVIIDSETAAFRALERLYEEYGVDSAGLRDTFLRSAGVHPSPDYLAPIKSLMPVDLIESIHARRREYRNDLLRSMGLRPGVKAWLIEARQIPIALGLASSAPSSWVNPWLEAAGILPWFNVVQCWEPHLRPKPYPDLYLAACVRLGVKPADAVAVEDSFVGLSAATSAGMRTVAVPTEITRDAHLEASISVPKMDSERLVDVIRALSIA